MNNATIASLLAGAALLLYAGSMIRSTLGWTFILAGAVLVLLAARGIVVARDR